MSKAAKQGIFVLIFLIVGVLGFLGYTLFEMKKVDDAKMLAEEQLEQAELRENRQMKKVKDLTKELDKIKQERDDLTVGLQSAKDRSTTLQASLDKITKERDKFKIEMASISKSRDVLDQKVKSLMAEVSQTQDKLKKQVQLAKDLKGPSGGSDQNNFAQTASQNIKPFVAATIESQIQAKMPDSIPPASDEQYWATLLKEKAGLEVKIEHMEESLAKSSIDIVELKQLNDDLQLELDTLKTESDDLASEIKYKSNMINNLSLELARTKNDKKFISDRLTKIQDENRNLRGDMKQLVTAKSSLQKSIVRLTQDKNKVERELGGAESLIQSKIDEIWEIKDSLDRSFKETSRTLQNPNSVELPPIMVSAKNGSAIEFDVGASEPGFHGRIVSVNKENNFVILDLGEASGVNLGDDISVYRNSKYIGRLEIIQVRKDISAADIKDQWANIQVGDIIR